ncbi:MAG: 2'-5' RNA ligase family protein [Actinomycetales bacterium]|nr:2'-5' RNA ligase family protein [Actinomycetales bacterium]
MTLQPDTCVVGIVVRVPEPWGEDLTQWRAGFGDPHADRMPAHVTVLPPLRMSTLAFSRLADALHSEVGGVPAFDVSLGPVGTFRPVSPVVFLEAHASGGSLDGLHGAVNRAAGSPPLRHPFHPHVTVAMDLPDAVLDAAASALSDYRAAWTVTEVCVFLRDGTGHWHEQYKVGLRADGLHNH